jgi:hypothetical protein
MPWVRLEDTYPINRKVGTLSDGAFRLDVEAMCWSARETSDGVVRAHELVLVRARATKRHAAELVAHGRWHEAGHSCPSAKCPESGPDGWVIHDYFDYQPAREQVIKDREARAERMRRWRESQRNGRAATDASTNGATNTARDGPRDALVTPPPSPPRPAPKEGGEGTSPQRQPPAAQRRGRGGGGEQVQTRSYSPRCPTCGNGTDSAYHRNTCVKIGAA